MSGVKFQIKIIFIAHISILHNTNIINKLRNMQYTLYFVNLKTIDFTEFYLEIFD